MYSSACPLIPYTHTHTHTQLPPEFADSLLRLCNNMPLMLQVVDSCQLPGVDPDLLRFVDAIITAEGISGGQQLVDKVLHRGAASE